jgi:hypothetical protein
MAIRRQTVALLVLLGGVVLFAALYHWPRVSDRGLQPSFYAAAPAQVAGAFAKLRTPTGLSPTRRNCSADEACFYRSPSLTLSPARIVRWLAETGLAHVRRSVARSMSCGNVHRRNYGRLVLTVCNGVQANEGNVVISAFANSVLLKGAHELRPTTALLGKAETGFKATELHLLYDGVPTPEAVRAEQAVAKEHG